MKTSITKRLLAALSMVQISLISLASAHPGPPGHTHADDWPFGFIPLLGVMALIFFVFKLVRRQS